jgi:hypothetical protein
MARNQIARQQKSLELPFAFADRFLSDHAGYIMEEPKVAVIELIANSYDAGSKKVLITWPDQLKENFIIEDDGTGMTVREFELRWKTLCYNRAQDLGSIVTFPPGVTRVSRIAFGKNGKGRHAAFCFGDEYTVETTKAGKKTQYKVSLKQNSSEPFACEQISIGRSSGHGTKITVSLSRNLISASDLIELIGSKFLVDPSFGVTVNGKKVELTDLKTPLAVI